MKYAMCALGMLVWTSAHAAASPDSSAELRKEAQGLRTREGEKLLAIADGLTAKGQRKEADQVRALIDPGPIRDGATRHVPLVEVIPATRPATQIGLARASAIREETAGAMFKLADRAAKAGRFELTSRLLRGVIERQADHKEARRLLGYMPHLGGWATPFAVKKITDGWVLHPVFGWVEKDWVTHLDKGLLPDIVAAGRPVGWLPAVEADALRADFKKAWTISTEHFQIRTNVPLSEAIAFGRQLEAFHDLFFALFADVIGPRTLPLAQRYANPAWKPPRNPKLHQVWYYATQDEYISELMGKHGAEVKEELGRYDFPDTPGGQGRSYFFRDLDGKLDVTATLYHEASHQVLFESAGKNDYQGNVGNYWVFEGLGTYFETLTPQPDGSILIGGQVGPRMEQAWLRGVEKKTFLPLSRFLALDEARFKDARFIYRNYPEAMALAVFLMQHDEGRYRDPFLDYVKDAYKGKIKRGEKTRLESKLGVPLETLDRELLDFLRAGMEKAKR